MYQINARDIEVFAYHGVLQEEKENGQIFRVDFDIELAEDSFPFVDELEYAVDYASIVDMINNIITGKKHNLLETVCREILDHLMSVQGVDHASVTVKKPDAPLAVKTGWVGITLAAGRDGQRKPSGS